MDELQETRKRLWRIDRSYVEVLTLRPNVAGLVVYGSLARGGLTRFSDIDIAVICDAPVTEYWVEHRMTYGARMDLLIERWDSLRTLPERTPHGLHEGTEISGYLMESLLLGGPETVLYDPTGEVTRIKESLQTALPYERLSRFTASAFFHYLTQKKLPEPEELLESGERSRAAERAGKLAQALGMVLRQITSLKVPVAAAERLGLAEFAPTLSRLHALLLPSPEEMAESYRAARSFLDLFLERVYAPALEAIRRSGKADPEELEFIGAHSLWWEDRTPRLWELGRAVGEWDYSLDWWGALVEEGKIDGALGMDLAGRDSGWYVERWGRLVEALGDAGYDVSADFFRLRMNPEYLRRARLLDEAFERTHTRAVTLADAKEAVELVQRLHRIIAEGIPFLTPEELEQARSESPDS
ncbi:MAG: nucleotidyltransferase domain-containing protein [Armatimonadetes bacterium]|nr:nucleotidyltransferase domain-containing protein [Armatimonadota bacterium]